MGRETFHQTRLLTAPSNEALDISRYGAATASLGSLGQHLTTLTTKNFFLISNLNLHPFSLKPLSLILPLQDKGKNTKGQGNLLAVSSWVVTVSQWINQCHRRKGYRATLHAP